MAGRLVVVGLGNPGPLYTNTRHNVGRRCVEALARRIRLAWRRDLPSASLAYGQTPHGELVLVRPRTFMNHSGRAVAQVVRHLEVDLRWELLVLCDDMDLPLGKLRLRLKGSSGGHRGLQSVIVALGSEEFPRLRIGIGRPPPGVDPVEYVLSPFTSEEEGVIAKAVERASAGVSLVLERGVERAMDWVNAG
ncbi:MAG: aminoacyl-tRNA hydrolase [Dehalococcoidia bacterium]